MLNPEIFWCPTYGLHILFVEQGGFRHLYNFQSIWSAFDILIGWPHGMGMDTLETWACNKMKIIMINLVILISMVKSHFNSKWL